jgi:hypothetical protein
MLWIVNTNLDIYVCITITSLIHLLVDWAKSIKGPKQDGHSQLKRSMPA